MWSCSPASSSASPRIDNKLVLFVTNIQRDTLPQNGLNGRAPAAGVVETRPPLHLNLYVMIAACFGGANYGEGLKRLSAAVAFFQANPVFDAQRSPELDRRISRLVLDIENLDSQTISHLWGVLGGTYLP
jgi:Pvc16 N-terminal domain